MLKRRLMLIALVALCAKSFGMGDYFWYKVFGIDNYSYDPENPHNLETGKQDDSLHVGFQSCEHNLDFCSISHKPFVNVFSPDDMPYGDDYSNLNYNEFTVLHMHGCSQHLYFPPTYSGGPIAFRTPDQCYFGGAYLKWMWSASCSWFSVQPGYAPAPDSDLRQFLTGGSVNWYKDYDLNPAERWAKTDGFMLANPLSGFRLTQINNGDWFKFKLKKEIPETWELSHFQSMKVWFLFVENAAQVKVYLGSETDTDLSLRNITGRTLLGTLNVNSDGGYSLNLENKFAPGVIAGERCLYFEFTGMPEDDDNLGQLSQIDFKLNDDAQVALIPHLCRDGIMDTMETRRAHWDDAFHGVHAIMGWGSVTYAQRDRKMYRHFFKHWAEQEECLVFAYIDALEAVTNYGPLSGQIPALAYATGDPGNGYEHDILLYEKFHETPGTRADDGCYGIYYSMPDDMVDDSYCGFCIH